MAHDERSRFPDYLIATALFFAALGVLVATNDMGFVRDEAFYFGHAETYSEWFYRLAAGKPERKLALQRAEILATWHQNAEHPPLDKMLFGLSWRTLGRKLRPAANFHIDDQEVFAEVQQLAPTHGFAVGAKVALLKPQLGDLPPEPKNRRLAQGEVVERTPSHAVVRLEGGTDLAKLTTRCQAPGTLDGELYLRTGCEFVETRFSYVLSESAALRFPNAVFASLLVAFLYLAARLLFASRETAAGYGQVARPFAVAAGVGYLCIPQPFWHAHLCAFDTTITALLFLTTLTWHRALRSRAWLWPTAILWGISLLAKHNALFLPVPLLLHWLWDAAAEGRIQLTMAKIESQTLKSLVPLVLLAPLLGWLLHPLAMLAVGVLILARVFTLRLPPVPTAFFLMLPVGAVILVIGWPLLWVDTLDNLLHWIEFHLHHEHYMQQYFGRILAYPPFPITFSWVMTALTWPITLLAPFVFGLGVFAARSLVHFRRKRAISQPVSRSAQADLGAEQRSFDRLLLLSVVWPMALISLPGTPIFGGTKHWMVAYPFMLLIAARGLHFVWQALFAPPDLSGLDPVTGQWVPLLPSNRPAWWRQTLVPAFSALLLTLIALLPAAQATADVHPDGSAYYNELIGGLRGAAEAQMQRQFWGGSTREGLAEINRRAPPNSSIWFHKSAYGAYVMYQREGWLRRDLRYTTEASDRSALGTYHHQKDHDDYELELWQSYQSTVPVDQSAIDGVPILSVYQRPLEKPRQPAAVN